MATASRKQFIFQPVRAIMVEVIVTNEFPRLNADSERRPFKVLTPPERSSKLVIARYTPRPQRQKQAENRVQPEPQDMVWRAILVGSLCAALAFGFFSWSQRNWFQRAGGTVGPMLESTQRLRFAGSPNETAATQAPIPTSAESGAMPAAQAPADAKSLKPPTGAAQTFALPAEAPNLTVTEFNLSVNPEFQRVGDVALRLAAVNNVANTYDITVRTQRREFYRQDVKLAEHIPLSRNETIDGPELVVGAISENRVFGYVSEPRYRGHRRHRRR